MSLRATPQTNQQWRGTPEIDCQSAGDFARCKSRRIRECCQQSKGKSEALGMFLGSREMSEIAVMHLCSLYRWESKRKIQFATLLELLKTSFSFDYDFSAHPIEESHWNRWAASGKNFDCAPGDAEFNCTWEAFWSFPIKEILTLHTFGFRSISTLPSKGEGCHTRLSF